MSLRFSSYTPRVFFLLVLLASPLAACDSSNADLTDGTFEARVSGSAETTLNGLAAFAVETEDGETVSAIGLVNTADDEDAVFLLVNGRAAAQTYAVGGTAAGAILVLHGTGDEGAVYIADSGTITVDRADAARLSGSFDVTATSLVEEGERVRLQGSFHAKAGAVTPPADTAPRLSSGA